MWTPIKDAKSSGCPRFLQECGHPSKMQKTVGVHVLEEPFYFRNI
jgi:hypothetical protein